MACRPWPACLSGRHGYGACIRLVNIYNAEQFGSGRCLCMLRATFKAHHYKNTAYDLRFRLCERPSGSTSEHSKAICHATGRRAHPLVVSGVTAANVVHAAQWPGMRLVAVEPATLFSDQYLDGLADGPGCFASDPGRGIRRGHARTSGATDLVANVPPGFGFQWPDPGQRSDRPGAYG